MLSKEELMQPNPEKLKLLTDFVIAFKVNQTYIWFSQLRGVSYQEYLDLKKYIFRTISEEEYMEASQFVDNYFENGHPDFVIMLFHKQWGKGNE